MRPVYGSEIRKGQLHGGDCFHVVLRCGGVLQRGKGQQGELSLCACPVLGLFSLRICCLAADGQRMLVYLEAG